MRAAVVVAPNQLAVEELPDPTPAPGEVLVAVKACGICGTDLHIAQGEYQPVHYPVVLGHEFAGEVVGVGAEVATLRIGDRVAVDPSLYCGQCHYCRSGRDNLCTGGGGLGSTAPGAAADLVAAPAHLAYRLPDDVSYEHAALIEPLACAVHGFDLLPRTLGASYLIYGAGTMGLLMASLAMAAGAGSVSMVDLDSRRRAAAGKRHLTAVAESATHLDRGEWDVVIDCTGASSAICDGIGRLARGGTFLQFGVANPELTIQVSPFRLYRDEITLLGSRAVLRNFDAAMRLMARGVVDAATLIGERIALRDYDRALALTAAGTDGKVLVIPDHRDMVSPSHTAPVPSPGS